MGSDASRASRWAGAMLGRHLGARRRGRDAERARRLFARLRAAALVRSAPSAREVLAAGAAALAVGMAAHGSHLADGGFYSDDWINAADHAFGAEPGLEGAVAHALDRRFFEYRPPAAVAIALQHQALGRAPVPHLAMALALAALAAVGLFTLLRTLGLERLHAGAIAALVLLFPWADSVRLWPTAALNHLSLLLWMGGVMVAVRGLRARPGRQGLAHLGALLLYAAAILMYELAAGLVVASFLLYATQARWRAWLPRFGADAGAAAGTVLVMGLNTTRSPEPLEGQLAHAGLIAEEAVSLLAVAAAPALHPEGAAAIGLPLAMAAVVGAAIATHRFGQAAELRRWSAIAGIGAAGVVAGYLLIVPAHESFSPLAPGLRNRVNIFSALGHVAVAYSAIVLLAKLAAAAVPRARGASLLLGAALVAAMAGGYLAESGDHKAAWARATAEQGRVLRAFDRLPPLPPGSVVYAFGAPIDVAPGVPVFRHLDLRAAVQLRLGDPAVAAYPMYPGTELVCGRRDVHAEGPGYGLRGPAVGPNEFLVEAIGRYGRAYLLDPTSGRWDAIRGRAECRAKVGGYVPGPLVAEGPSP